MWGFKQKYGAEIITKVCDLQSSDGIDFRSNNDRFRIRNNDGINIGYVCTGYVQV